MASTSAQAQGQAMSSKTMPMPDVAPVRAALMANYDRIFIIHAAQTNMAEIMMGQLALRKSRHAGVRMVAQTTLRDHRNAQRDLAPLFRTMGMTVPPGPNVMQKATYAMLSKLRGAAFDKAYMDAQIGGHENSVTLFQHQAEHGKNPTAKAHAVNKLPHLLHHTAMIYGVARQVGAPGIRLRPTALTTLPGHATMTGSGAMMNH
jgi:putative membrane protein